MPFTYSYPTLSNPIDKNEIESNFSDLSQKLGSLTSGDLSATANIASTQLASPYQEVWITLGTTAAWPAANTIVDAAALPGSVGDSTWAMTDVTWVCSDVGDGAGTFNIVVGSYSNVGVWTTTMTHVNGASISNNGGAVPDNSGYQGTALSAGSTAIAFAASVPSIALQVNAQGANVTNAGFLKVTVCLKRYLTTL